MIKRKRRVSLRRFFPAIAAVFFLLLTGLPAHALEGGGSHYFGGNEDFGAGGWPPPGLSVNLSVLNFNWDRLKDGDGKTMSIPHQVDGISTSLRFMYTTKIDLLGHTLGWFITPALVYQHVLSGPRTQSKTELGDLNFGVVLKKQFGNFSHTIGSDIFAPTGQYSKDELNNIGVNYWTLGPTYAFTWVAGLNSTLPGFEVSGRTAYYFHTANHATNYTSGQEITADYLVGKWFGQRGQYKIGINGHFSWQTTDDTWRDAPADFDGHRTRQLTVGPAFQYVFPNNAQLTLKVQWGVYDMNHGEGNNLWLKFWYPLMLR